MASLCYLAAVVFLVCCLPGTVGKKNATIQPRNNTVVERTIKALNTTNNSTGCNLFVEKSKIEEILNNQDQSATTNIVNLKVSIYHGKKTRYFQELQLPWASEIGRTIVSLVGRARYIIRFATPVLTWALEVGKKVVEIKVIEETDGCLPPGEEGTDRIFDFLLQKLSHSEDKHVFKLCRIHEDKSIKYARYNCCRIAGEKNLTICADYSSAVVEWALPIIIVILLVSVFFVFPFVLQYITTYPTPKFYKISESHMSLISLVSKVFCEGRGPVKSFFRRCVFVVLTYFVLFFPNFFGQDWLLWSFIAWFLCFVFFNDIQMTTEEVKKEYIQQSSSKCKSCKNHCLKPQWDTNIISCFSLPFYCLNKTYEGISCCFDCCKCTNLFSSSAPFEAFALLLLSVLYVILVAICLLKFFFIDLIIFFAWPLCFSKKYCSNSTLNDILLVLSFTARLLLRLLTVLTSLFFTGMTFISVFSTVVGLALNVEFFNPFIAPITTIILYFWKDWRSSVEGECLQLKTLIIQVCKEKSPESRQAPENRQTLNTSGGNNNKDLGNFLCSCIGDCSSTKPDTEQKIKVTFDKEQKTKVTSGREQTEKEVFINIPQISDNGKTLENIPKTVKFNKHGEAMISIALYKEVENIILPLDHLLFSFFRRVIFVGLYALCLFIVMIAFRESGISESVQLISTIAGVMIPFVFNTIFADDHFSQKNSKIAATKGKLEHILKVNKYENNTIFVEVINFKEWAKVYRRYTW